MDDNDVEIRGFKAFNKDLTNRYGQEFLEGERYLLEGPISFGLHSNGFHFCERLEDTLRYFDAMNEEICIAEVIGRGEIASYYDDYYGYYDMYAVSDLEIVRFLSRDEIVGSYLNCDNGNRVRRFVSGFKLTEDEIHSMQEAHKNNAEVLKALDYYQRGFRDTYEPKKVKRYLMRSDSSKKE